MKIKKIFVRSTAGGQKIELTTYFFRGSQPSAPKAYIQSSVHGAEVQGNGVIHFLMEQLEINPPLGDVTLVPLANPVATDRKCGDFTDGRVDPTTGVNWNRAYWMPVIESEKQRSDPGQALMPEAVSREKFRNLLRTALEKKKTGSMSYAQKLALTLQSMAVGADLVLDLHNSYVSVPHVYVCREYTRDALPLGIPALVAIPPVFSGALDEAIFAPWSLYKKRFGGSWADLPQSYTIELGNQEVLDLARAKKEADGILQLLIAKGVCRGKARKPSGSFVVGKLEDYKILHAPAGALYDYASVLGKSQKEGAVLATALQFAPAGSKRTTVQAPFDFFPLRRFSSAVVHEGDELFRGFSKWERIRG